MGQFLLPKIVSLSYNDKAWLNDSSGNLATQLNPTTQDGSSGLGKGVLGYDTTTKNGIHIVHSLEGFPIPLNSTNFVVGSSKTPDQRWFPTDSILSGFSYYNATFGHSFLCTKVQQSSLMQVMTTIKSSNPSIYTLNAGKPYADEISFLLDGQPTSSSTITSNLYSTLGYQLIGGSDIWNTNNQQYLSIP
ncbi:hypothetical protein PPL_03641, partial [Heterostelium album PN500]